VSPETSECDSVLPFHLAPINKTKLTTTSSTTEEPTHKRHHCHTRGMSHTQKTLLLSFSVGHSFLCNQSGRSSSISAAVARATAVVATVAVAADTVAVLDMVFSPVLETTLLPLAPPVARSFF
jgi:hypothetical protein